MDHNLYRCLHGCSMSYLQGVQDEWSTRNFGAGGDGTLAFIGMIEELGEMADAIGFPPDSDPEVVRAILLMGWLGTFAHATLKRIQGIRQNEDHRANAARAIQRLLDTAEPVGGIEDAFDLVVEEGRPTDLPKLTDGLGDLVIFGLDVCNRKGINFEDAVVETCEEVFARDWVKNKNDGVSA